MQGLHGDLRRGLAHGRVAGQRRDGQQLHPTLAGEEDGYALFRPRPVQGGHQLAVPMHQRHGRGRPAVELLGYGILGRGSVSRMKKKGNE